MRTVKIPSQSKMEFYLIAFAAGVLGASIMSLVLTWARALEVTQLNLELMLGSLLTGTEAGATWGVGLIWQLLNGGIFGLIYAAGFMVLGRANTAIGMGFGAIHWILSGISMGLVPMMHPLVPEAITAPGFFAIAGGSFDFSAQLLLHLLFGGVLGFSCQKAVAAARAERNGVRDFRVPAYQS